MVATVVVVGVTTAGRSPLEGKEQLVESPFLTTWSVVPHNSSRSLAKVTLPSCLIGR